MSKRLLLAEDDEGFREALLRNFEKRGYTVSAIASILEYEEFEQKPFDYAVIDLKLTDGTSLGLVQSLRLRNPSCRILVLTGFGTVSTAVLAVKAGATNFLNKPAGIQEILASLEHEPTAESLASDQLKIPTLAQMERHYIDYALSMSEGNISKAAQILGIHRQSLQRKLRTYPTR